MGSPWGSATLKAENPTEKKGNARSCPLLTLLHRVIFGAQTAEGPRAISAAPIILL